MKISREWLQTFFEKELPSAEELSTALTFHAFEIDGIENDVLDVKVTPNRGHDCLSYRGIAKEVSAILNIPLKDDPLGPKYAPTGAHPAPKNLLDVRVESPLCNRYIAGYIKGVKVGPSPEWLVQRLAAMGQQSINNVVDATNFVMFNLGQPLHAFDAAKLTEKDGGRLISVRTARPGEKLTALDTKEYTLTESMLVIVDANADVPIGVAGVKGGMPAGISEATTDIILESANFDGVSVRKTAQTLKLRTDASQRFEQVISPELASYGMEAAGVLIEQIAAAKELVGFVDVYPRPQEKKTVSVTLAKINKVLGTTLTGAEAEDAFTRLGFSPTTSGETYTIHVPFERLDLSIPEDLVEEVARTIGYEKIQGTELAASSAPEVHTNFYFTEKIREFLVSRGFSEVFTSVFDYSGEREVLNKVGGERPFLRDSIGGSLLNALERNSQIKEIVGRTEVRLFEIGPVWLQGKEKMQLAIGTLGGKKTPKPGAIFEELFKEFGVSVHLGTVSLENGGSVAFLDLDELFKAQIAPNAYDSSLPLSTTERYHTYSRFPFIVRDIALWVPAETSVDEVRKIIADAAGSLMLRIDLFDQFKKENQVSFAYRLVFQSNEKTLTDADAQAAMDAVYAALLAKGWVVR